jgi:hypothetical protein
MPLKQDTIYWLIAHRHHRMVNLFCHGMSLSYPLFVYLFLKWKRDKTIWNDKACITLSFDCDYEEDIMSLPQILEMLARYEIPASFACIGKWVEKFPEIHRRLVGSGHEIINHSYSHPDNEQLDPDRRFNELSYGEKVEQIERCHSVCKQLLNYEPVGFRTPHFGNLFSTGDYPILKELGYSYSSSTLAVATPENGQPFLSEEGILEFPLSPCPKHPFSIFDSWHTTSTRTPGSVHRDEADFLRWFTKLVDLGITTRSYINVYWDPQDIVKVKSFEQALKYLAERRNKLWLATYRQVAGRLGRAQTN